MSDPKETRSEAFAAVNPRCKTPTFVDVDGTIVIESLAILQYLETYYPSPSFTPSTNDKAAYTICLKRFHESENIHNVCEGLEFIFHDNPSEHVREIVSSHDGTLKELEFWENYTREHKYVAGDEFTIADCAFWPVLGYLDHRGLSLDGEEWRGLRVYAARMKGRIAEAETMPWGWERKGRVNLFEDAIQMKAAQEHT